MQACAHLENSTSCGGGGPDKIFSHKRVSQRAVRFLGPIAARGGSELSLEFLGNLLPPVIFQEVAIHTPFPPLTLLLCIRIVLFHFQKSCF